MKADFWDACEVAAQATGTLYYNLASDFDDEADEAAGPTGSDDGGCIVAEFCRRLAKSPSCSSSGQFLLAE